MARFDRSKEKRSFRNNSPRRDRTSGSRKFADRDFSRKSRSRGNNRGNIQRTRVTCSACGKECEVPFKPTSSKPVYCDECFSKTSDRSGSRLNKKDNSHDFDIINEKLNKIMKALKIE